MFNRKRGGMVLLGALCAGLGSSCVVSAEEDDDNVESFETAEEALEKGSGTFKKVLGGIGNLAADGSGYAGGIVLATAGGGALVYFKDKDDKGKAAQEEKDKKEEAQRQVELEKKKAEEAAVKEDEERDVASKTLALCGSEYGAPEEKSVLALAVLCGILTSACILLSVAIAALIVNGAPSLYFKIRLWLKVIGYMKKTVNPKAGYKIKLYNKLYDKAGDLYKKLESETLTKRWWNYRNYAKNVQVVAPDPAP